MLRNDTPLFLPEGSVRAILALAVVSLVAAAVLPVEALFLVLGFYFADRAGSASA